MHIDDDLYVAADDDSSEGEIDTSDPWFKEAMNDVVLNSAEPVKPKSKSKSKKQTKEERIEQQKKKAELELLLGDSANAGEGFDMKEVLKREKLASKKGKIGKKAKKLLEETDDFEINTQDPRFAALQDSHHFAIDPTNPHFKKTKAMTTLMQSRQKKLKNANNMEEKWVKDSKVAKKNKVNISNKDKSKLYTVHEIIINANSYTLQPQPAAENSKIKDASLAALVNSVKRKGALNVDNADKPKGKRSKSN